MIKQNFAVFKTSRHLYESRTQKQLKKYLSNTKNHSKYQKIRKCDDELRKKISFLKLLRRPSASSSSSEHLLHKRHYSTATSTKQTLPGLKKQDGQDEEEERLMKFNSMRSNDKQLQTQRKIKQSLNMFFKNRQARLKNQTQNIKRSNVKNLRRSSVSPLKLEHLTINPQPPRQQQKTRSYLRKWVNMGKQNTQHHKQEYYNSLKSSRKSLDLVDVMYISERGDKNKKNVQQSSK